MWGIYYSPSLFLVQTGCSQLSSARSNLIVTVTCSHLSQSCLVIALHHRHDEKGQREEVKDSCFCSRTPAFWATQQELLRVILFSPSWWYSHVRVLK